MLGLANTLTGGSVSEWTPEELGTALQVWLKNDTDITNLSGTDGEEDNRLQWSDQSGNANHAFQDTNDNKPTITGGGLDFALESSDYMTFTSGFDFDHPKPFTMFFVVRRESVLTQCALLGQSATEFVAFKNNDDKVGVRNAGTGGDNVTVTFAESNLWPTSETFIFAVSKDANGDLLFYKDGVNKAESGGGTSRADGDQMDILYLGSKTGSSHNFDGIMYEVIISNRLLSDADMANVDSYLKGKFTLG